MNMKKVGPTNYSLHLQHNEFEDHNEYWLVVKNKIDVLSICPHNSPSKSEHTLDYAEALRQYALMTSEIEDWHVEDERIEWHNFVEGLQSS